MSLLSKGLDLWNSAPELGLETLSSAVDPSGMLANGERGLIHGDEAVERREAGEAELKKAGVKDMFEGEGDQQEVGKYVKGVEGVEKAQDGATKLGAWVHDLF